MKSKAGYMINKGDPFTMGTKIVKNGIHFTISLPVAKECYLNLYDVNTGVLLDHIRLTQEFKTGNVFSVFLKEKKRQTKGKEEPLNVNADSLAYLYQINDKEFLDPCASILYGRDKFGDKRNLESHKIFGGVTCHKFDWQGDIHNVIPFDQLIIYKLHIRGFTMDSSSQVINKGTFAGVTQKIPYLLELGINCVQLMPAYDFNEIISLQGIENVCKVNYWGYCEENSYFAPKASYGVNPRKVDVEFKEMVKALHIHGIEVIMEMNFVEGLNPVFMLECLRYWVFTYHVDGFRLPAYHVPVSFFAADPYLGQTKFLAENWDESLINKGNPQFKNISIYNQEYSNIVKRFLRSDEEQAFQFSKCVTRNSEHSGVVNYITNHDGFTLMDLVSYDTKHNNDNGEKNQDGIDYNYSWNCGVEGPTKKKSILGLRKKQIINAFTILLFSQGTPLILSGDEFGNSQKGNNNAYCQDNEVSWLNWNDLNKNKEIFDTVKSLIEIRKAHPVLHKSDPNRGMDYIYCGFPDLSFHGLKAWYPDYNHYSRILGIMYSGFYAKLNKTVNDNTFYIAYNFHWEKHTFYLPNPPKGEKWYMLFHTAESATEDILTESEPLENQRQCEVIERTIVVLYSKS